MSRSNPGDEPWFEDLGTILRQVAKENGCDFVFIIVTKADQQVALSTNLRRRELRIALHHTLHETRGAKPTKRLYPN